MENKHQDTLETHKTFDEDCNFSAIFDTEFEEIVRDIGLALIRRVKHADMLQKTGAEIAQILKSEFNL